LSMADSPATTDRLLDALERLTTAAKTFESPPPVQLPEPGELELETVKLPRDAFFGAKAAVSAEEAIGRIAAEQITPYPPGIPVLVPGERVNAAVVDYLRSGINAGMVVPDAADRNLDTILVTV
jgi:arginine decarboxylase